ncbi:hypothetical protein EVJ58_g4541 [Rhodofomes roseus]|uniref:Uncharacterized protein n=1 Tax=Rhodofomes roseus TaxID=34475 RepID=A0A4Y9YHQ8_9APHY|nr:hypothetical protein EVJ58_g4541 [Rhodofomes roseus]
MHLFTVLLLVLDIAFIVPPQTCERRVSVVTRRCRSSATDQLPISYYKLYIAAGIVFCFLYLVWGAASALRAFAINGRKYGLPAMVMAVSLLPVVTNVLNLATIYVVPISPPSNCAILSKASTPVMRNCMFFLVYPLDAMVVLATWQVTGGIRSLAEGIDINVPTTRRLLRDGTIYFLYARPAYAVSPALALTSSAVFCY